MKLLLEAWKQFTEGAGDYLEPNWKTHDQSDDDQPTDFELDRMNQESVWDRLWDEGAEDAASAVPLNFELPLTDEQEEYYKHLDSEDKQSMLQDVIDELVMDGKVGKVGDSLYYPIRG